MEFLIIKVELPMFDQHWLVPTHISYNYDIISYISLSLSAGFLVSRLIVRNTKSYRYSGNTFRTLLYQLRKLPDI